MTYIKLQDTEEYIEIQQAVADAQAAASAAHTSEVNSGVYEANAYQYMLAAQAAAKDNREVPAGLVNGTNKIFTASNPFVAGSARLYLNGNREPNFTEISDTQIQLIDAPLNVGFTDRIEITYIKK